MPCTSFTTALAQQAKRHFRKNLQDSVPRIESEEAHHTPILPCAIARPDNATGQRFFLEAKADVVLSLAAPSRSTRKASSRATVRGNALDLW